MISYPTGVSEARWYAYLLYMKAWLAISSRYPIGTNVFERDWELLIVLDACRVDALQEVASEYDFLDSIDSIRSVASTSDVWMAQTFTGKHRAEIQRTAYISANAYAKRVIEDRELPGSANLTDWDVVFPEDFLLLDQAWEHQVNHTYPHMLSEDLTDRAITVGREHNPPRQIVHYLQPHEPYIANSIKQDRKMREYEEDPLGSLRDGNVSRSVVWNAYLDDLRRCLDHVETLLQSIDADRAVITADHGEAFGEWRTYGHLCGNLHPVVKRVPWVETSASDSGQYQPVFEYESDQSQSLNVDQQLEDLGYKL